MSLELPAFSGRLAACHRACIANGLLLLQKLDTEADAFCSSDIVVMVGIFTLLLGKDNFRVHSRRGNRSHFESRNFFHLDESHS